MKCFTGEAPTQPQVPPKAAPDLSSLQRRIAGPHYCRLVMFRRAAALLRRAGHPHSAAALPPPHPAARPGLRGPCRACARGCASDAAPTNLQQWLTGYRSQQREQRDRAQRPPPPQPRDDSTIATAPDAELIQINHAEAKRVMPLIYRARDPTQLLEIFEQEREGWGWMTVKETVVRFVPSPPPQCRLWLRVVCVWVAGWPS